MVYLNGAFMPLEDARIPVLDRGFIFGDGVYEVIPVYSRHPFRLGEHLQRLQHSLDGIRLSNPLSEARWQALITELIARNTGEDQYLYLHITRGVASRDHAFPPADTAPTVFMMSSLLLPANPALRAHGVSAICAQDNRWLHCDIKAISLLPNVLLRQLGVDAGAAETILLRDGYLTEGAASSIFIVKAGILLAPPQSQLMLPGITYDVVLELAAANDIPCHIAPVPESELRSADEIWLTSSTREVQAITQLDGQPVGNGAPGPTYKKMDQLYQDFKASTMRLPTP
ncbi:MAG: D-amino acid aminotransferase [Sulfuricellaceae bacterium]|nr:D-amino acid aminotransferase [Sulfuricellaceae bacterium]